MKIIFSRKGFDGGTGCVPSPIMDTGEFFSLPIPEPKSEYEKLSYSDIEICGHNLGHIVQDLKAKTKDKSALNRDSFAHLDPDLIHSALKDRPSGWKPALGQVEAAQVHLENERVCKGDIFLFFGWFRNTRFQNGTYSYDNEDKNGKHVIFGWLQIGDIIPRDGKYPEWAQQHTHYLRTTDKNTLYIATDKLDLNGQRCELPGGGAFSTYNDQLCLTLAESSKSYWKLPSWIRPHSMSYHTKQSRWTPLYEDFVRLKTVGRGQEFVVALDDDNMGQATKWLYDLLSCTPIHKNP